MEGEVEEEAEGGGWRGRKQTEARRRSLDSRWQVEGFWRRMGEDDDDDDDGEDEGPSRSSPVS